MVRIGGTQLDFVPRKTFEQLAQIKPPNLKFVPREATAAFDTHHYSQWAAITNNPDPNIEKMIRDMYDQAALQRTIQQLNINGVRFGVPPLAAPVVPASLQANIAQAQQQQAAAVAHQQRTLLQTQNDGVAAAAQQAAMGKAATGPDLATQSRDDQTAMAMAQAQPARPGFGKRALDKAGRVGKDVAAAAGAYMLDSLYQNMTSAPAWMQGAWNETWRTGGHVFNVVDGAMKHAQKKSATQDQNRLPGPDGSSIGQMTNMIIGQLTGATGGSSSSSSSSSAPALTNAQNLEAILRNQLAGLVRRRELTQDDTQAKILDAQIADMRLEIEAMHDPGLAKDKKRVRELRHEAMVKGAMGDREGHEADMTLAEELERSIAHRMRKK